MMKSLSKIFEIHKAGIKIYPVIRRYKFAVCIEDNYNQVYKRTKTVGEFKHTTRTINKALEKTIDYIFNKL